MKKQAFSLPMKSGEAAFGWAYLFIHIFLLSYGLSLVSGLLKSIGISLTASELNTACYALGAVLTFIFMFRYLRKSFFDMCDNLLTALTTVIVGYLVYMIATSLLQMALSFIVANLVNPNSEVVKTATKLNPNLMLAAAGIFAPIVEEVLFRGTVFGSIRKKHRFLAYAVSTVLFAFYHLWQDFIFAYDWTLFLCLLQYLPAGIILCWCYERSRSIWGPIFLHSAINLVSVYFTLKG